MFIVVHVIEDLVNEGDYRLTTGIFDRGYDTFHFTERGSMTKLQEFVHNKERFLSQLRRDIIELLKKREE